MTVLRPSVSTAALGLLCACSLEVTNSLSLPPLLRLVNAASGTTEVRAFINAAPEPLAVMAANSPSASCFALFPASHQVSFVEGTNTLGSVTSSYATDGSYTVLLVSAGTTFRALALEDNVIINPGNNGLRFINATSIAGDVYVTPSGTDPGAEFKAVGNLSPLALTNETPPYVQRSASHTRVRLYDVGATTTARADITIEGTFDDHLATVVFVDPTGPTDPGAFVVLPCQ